MQRIGVIDIGSNSMRLSVTAVLDSGGFHLIDEQKCSPRLAAHIDPEGNLDGAGIDALIHHLRDFQGLCRAHKVDRLMAIGTAALRKAANAKAIADRILDELGLAIDIVSGEREAHYGALAVMHTMAIDCAYLIDIGGGSTEITLLEGGRIAGAHSFPFGAVTIGDDWRDRTGFTLRVGLPAAARDLLRSAELVHRRPHAELIGIGGTIRSIARVHQAQVGYPLPETHNYELSPDTVRDLIQWLAPMPPARRKKIPGLSRDRADLIMSGGAILTACMDELLTTRLRVSGRGVRDGVFYSLRSDRLPEATQVLCNSVENTLLRYATPRDHAVHVTALALAMLEDLGTHAGLTKAAQPILYTASMLHRIGVQVNYYHYERHTFHLILGSSLYGLSHTQILQAALASSFKGRSDLLRTAAPYRALLTDDELALACRAGVITRLAEALDR
ncbi:MAG: Ppx/GppA phosphatase family protein, partial [Firmicutes bacterium]|nr:Ppx/GppA phosphatase family protein [Bacillota bacterium]